MGKVAMRNLSAAAYFILLGLLPSVAAAAETTTQAAPRPNIIFILADDLGYADLGCYGQKKIKSPHIDRLAAEGIRFTQVYCGTSVCAPSRCSLMTGLHMGHAQIRANRLIKPEGQEPIAAGTFTVARMLKQAGYRTGCFGKWGLGGPGSTGAPNKQGFDAFFGYLCQNQAHEYYPDHLWRNAERVPLDGKTYSHDLIVGEALAWMRQNADAPFFLYLPFTIPHQKFQVPDLGPYEREDWPDQLKTYAAMVTRMDGDIGRLMAMLKELGIDEKTIVFFASDNGAERYPEILEFFGGTGGLRGLKRSMYEGGLRVPMIVRWPGRSPAGKVSDEPWAFWDFLPTCAELGGAKVPAEVKLDGISVLPALRGGALPRREYFYWELHEGPMNQAVRFQNWKAVRPAPGQPVELYDLATDAAERRDVAADHADLVARAEKLMSTAQVDSPLWPVNPPQPGRR